MVIRSIVQAAQAQRGYLLSIMVLDKGQAALFDHWMV